MKDIDDDEMERILRRAGWYAGRQSDLSEWESYGMPLFPAARAFLSEFGGLTFTDAEFGRRPLNRLIDFRPDPMYREATDAELEKIAGERLYTIGSLDWWTACLYIGESGKFYLWGNWNDMIPIRYWAASLREALAKLI